MAKPQSFVTEQSIQALDRNRFTLADHGYSVISGCNVTISSGTLGSGNGAVHVDPGTVLEDFAEVDVAESDVDIPASDDTFPQKVVVAYDTSDSTLKTVQGTAEEADPTNSQREEAERPAPPEFDESVDALSTEDEPMIPLAEIWVPEGSDEITSNDIFDRRTDPLNTTNINSLSIEDFASKRRTFDVDLSEETTDERVLIGRVSDGTSGEDGKIVASFYHPVEPGNTFTSILRMNAAVRQSSFGADHYYLGDKAFGDNEVGFVLTETSGTGTNGENEYYLYLNPGGVTDGTVVIDHTNSFGEFTYTEDLTTTDYNGSVVYETNGNAASSIVEFGTVNTTNLSGSVTSNTDVSTLDGDNLEIDGSGNLNAAGPSTTSTLFMSDYSSGGVADTEFESAISDATAGDMIVFDRNSYELQNGHQISKSLIIDQTEDAEVVCTNTANADSSIEFLGGGQTGTSTTTSSAVSPGARSIAVNDSTGFSAGDDILVMDNAYAEQAAGPHQFLEIETVPDGTTINVLGSVVRDFVSGANVYVVDLIEKPVIRNITTRGGGTRHLAFRWCKDPLFEGASVSEYLEQSLYALDCWRPRWKDVEAIDPEAIGSGQGEPLALYRCSDAYVASPRIYDCRRGIDFAWGTHSVEVVDPVVHGADIAGISVHGDDICDKISIQGGTITNVRNATTGYGIINSASCSMTVEGTHFVSDRAGIANVGPMNASNCHFEPVGPSAQQAIQPVGSHGHYSNMTIKDPNADYESPVRIDTRNGDVRDISVEADIEYTDQNAVMIDSDSSGNSITDVKIRGEIHGGTSDQPIFVWAELGSVDQIDVSMDVYDTAGQCIRLLADDSMGVVRIHDCTLTSTDSACIFDSNELVGATIQINNCYLDSGSGGTTLSFNNGCENLFVLGNYISGSVDTSGTITNQVVSDNLP